MLRCTLSQCVNIIIAASHKDLTIDEQANRDWLEIHQNKEKINVQCVLNEHSDKSTLSNFVISLHETVTGQNKNRNRFSRFMKRNGQKVYNLEGYLQSQGQCIIDTHISTMSLHHPLYFCNIQVSNMKPLF